MHSALKDLPPIGADFEGGRFNGLFVMDGHLRASILAPKAYRIQDVEYGHYGEEIPGADSHFDSMANTVALAEADNDVARQILGLTINGFSDWAWAARDIVELAYRHFKPTDDESWRYSGSNPSSWPPGYPYKPGVPPQTPLAEFQAGGDEAIEVGWVWSSTQYSAYYAWYQDFGDGVQGNAGKGSRGLVLPVRSLILCPFNPF